MDIPRRTISTDLPNIANSSAIDSKVEIDLESINENDIIQETQYAAVTTKSLETEGDL